MELNGLNWEISFCQGPPSDSLRATLKMIPDEGSANFSCQAQATFKLIPKVSAANTIVRIQNITGTFNALNPSRSIELADVNSLLTTNEKISIEVELTVGPKYEKSSVAWNQQIRSKSFRMIVGTNGDYFELIRVGGTTWSINSYVYPSYRIGITLKLIRSDLVNHQWGSNVTFSYNFVSFDADHIPENHQFNHFYVEVDEHYSDYPYQFDSSFRQKYVRADKIFIDCEIDIGSPEPLWTL